MVPPPGPETGLYRLLAIFFFAASAGVVEEIAFRGFLYRAFRPNSVLNVLAFVIASTVLFALIHWEAGVGPTTYAGLWGLAFATLRIATGNLWPCITMHFAVDLVWFWSA